MHVLLSPGTSSLEMGPTSMTTHIIANHQYHQLSIIIVINNNNNNNTNNNTISYDDTED